MREVIEIARRHARLEGYHPHFLAHLFRMRMIATSVSNLDEYERLLNEDPGEGSALLEASRILHTCFFRDRATWTFLAERVVPHLLERADRSGRVNVWSPGCATGEELYGIAMLCAEQAGLDALRQLHLFGTDVSTEAIRKARHGEYSPHALDQVPSTFRDDYFIEGRGRYTVCSGISDSVAFARRDLLRDPPYLGLDLIVCRNTLIYFAPEIRAKLIHAFHFCLREGGYLVLGQSERSDDGEPPLFARLSVEHSVYRRIESDVVRPWKWMAPGAWVLRGAGIVEQRSQTLEPNGVRDAQAC